MPPCIFTQPAPSARPTFGKPLLVATSDLLAPFLCRPPSENASALSLVSCWQFGFCTSPPRRPLSSDDDCRSLDFPSFFSSTAAPSHINKLQGHCHWSLPSITLPVLAVHPLNFQDFAKPRLFSAVAGRVGWTLSQGQSCEIEQTKRPTDHAQGPTK